MAAERTNPTFARWLHFDSKGGKQTFTASCTTFGMWEEADAPQVTLNMVLSDELELVSVALSD